MKYSLLDSQINDIELELTGFCNLRCPLCANQYSFAASVKKKNIRPLHEWTRQLDRYPKLKSVCLAGIVSEPTLYPQLFELIDYLHKRNISIELYTNGNTHNNEWWTHLNSHMKCDDKVVFTICGSTQNIHARYRVGSDLNSILSHAMAYKLNNQHDNDWVQHIKFIYNVDDFYQHMKDIIQLFSHCMLINSSPYNERFYKCTIPEMSMPSNLSHKYTLIMNNAIDRRQQSKPYKIQCKSFETHFISIDQFGKIWPCFLYRLFLPDVQFSNLDYSDIFRYKYEFCYECELYTKKLLELNGMERMV